MNTKHVESVGKLAAGICQAMKVDPARVRRITFEVEPADTPLAMKTFETQQNGEQDESSLEVKLAGKLPQADEQDPGKQAVAPQDIGKAVLDALKIDPEMCGGLTLVFDPRKPVQAHIVRYLAKDEAARVITTLAILGEGWTQVRRGSYTARVEEMPCEPLPERKK